jgi:SAM-dependent methyltransferase
MGRPQIFIEKVQSIINWSIRPDYSQGQPQVIREHYLPQNYDGFENWSQYWFQIRSLMMMQPKSVLEIGIGNGLVADYLRKQADLNITTFDFDENLAPDFIGNVAEIDKYFQRRSFDVVLCSQVLEHLPYKYFEPTISKIASLCRTGLILGLPRYGRVLSFHFRFGRIKLKFDWMMPKIGMLKKPYPFSGEHYWEINTAGVHDHDIISVIRNNFNICKEISVWGDPYHVIYLCNTPIVKHC